MYYRQHGDRYGVGSYRHEPLLVDPRRHPRHGTAAGAGHARPSIRTASALDMPSLRPWTPDHFEAPVGGCAAADAATSPRRASTTRSTGCSRSRPMASRSSDRSRGRRGAGSPRPIWLTHGGGVGRLMADWITDGDPGLDVHEMDIDRFEPSRRRAPTSARAAPATTTRSTTWSIRSSRWASPGRCGRRPSTSGWRSSAPSSSRARAGNGPSGSGRNPATRPPARSGGPAQFWSTAAATEHRATREACRPVRSDVADQGHRRADRMPSPSCSASRRTTWRDRSGPSSTPRCATPPAASAATSRSRGSPRIATSWAATARRTSPTCAAPGDDDERVEVDEITSGTLRRRRVGAACPRPRPALSPDDLSNEAFPYLTAREIELDDVPVLAQRISYAGELGWELYAEAAIGRRLWDVLWAAGRDHSASWPAAAPRTTACAWRRATGRGART